jgi:hypothetical protein
MKLTREDYKRAAVHGVSAQLLYKRKNLGWELERAITERPKPVPKLPDDVAGWKRKAEYNGIDSSVFLARWRSGWELERAASAPVEERKQTNQIQKSFYKLASQNGISREVLITRVLHLNWDPERAATEQISR